MSIDLSIIILSYNTRTITQRCLNSLFNRLLVSKKITAEIIVIDNHSMDSSVEMLKKIKNGLTNFKLIINNSNLGYSKGNNQGIQIARGKYILFLNSDILIKNVDFGELLSYLNKHPDVGGLTVKVTLLKRGIDLASHRGFPTLWRSFCYFLKLDRLFNSTVLLKRIFGGYHLNHLNLKTIHEIDSPSGAFYLTRKDVLGKVGWFDESYFMYGEDLDLSYRIKEAGYKIIYYPRFNVLHLKYRSGLKKNNKQIQAETKNHFYQAMKIFYQKHYHKKYPWFINQIVYFLINFKINAV